jgi:hypothetical protein
MIAILFTRASPAAVPETFVICDRHFNRALVVLKDEPVALREFCVPLRGLDFYTSLFQLFKFSAGHLDLPRANSRET